MADTSGEILLYTRSFNLSKLVGEWYKTAMSGWPSSVFNVWNLSQPIQA